MKHTKHLTVFFSFVHILSIGNYVYANNTLAPTARTLVVEWDVVSPNEADIPKISKMQLLDAVEKSIKSQQAFGSRRQSSVRVLSPLRPSKTIRIFSSAENRLRVAFLICLTTSFGFAILQLLSGPRGPIMELKSAISSSFLPPGNCLKLSPNQIP